MKNRVRPWSAIPVGRNWTVAQLQQRVATFSVSFKGWALWKIRAYIVSLLVVSVLPFHICLSLTSCKTGTEDASKVLGSDDSTCPVCEEILNKRYRCHEPAWTADFCRLQQIRFPMREKIIYSTLYPSVKLYMLW